MDSIAFEWGDSAPILKMGTKNVYSQRRIGYYGYLNFHYYLWQKKLFKLRFMTTILWWNSILIKKSGLKTHLMRSIFFKIGCSNSMVQIHIFKLLQNYLAKIFTVGQYELRFPTVNGNIPLTSVFATFLPPLLDRKSCGKSHGKFTAVSGKFHIYNFPARVYLSWHGSNTLQLDTKPALRRADIRPPEVSSGWIFRDVRGQNRLSNGWMDVV